MISSKAMRQTEDLIGFHEHITATAQGRTTVDGTLRVSDAIGTVRAVRYAWSWDLHYRGTPAEWDDVGWSHDEYRNRVVRV